jgi:hypothetical protein
MKSLQNKQTTIEMPPENGLTPKADYGDLINILIKSPKQGGFDYIDMENRIAIDKAVKSGKEKTGEEIKMIELEDAPFKYLHELVKNAKWMFYHEDILTFKEDVLNVK